MIDIMAPANRRPAMAKLETSRNSVGLEVDSCYVTETATSLAPLAGGTEKRVDSFVENSEVEKCATPKSQEHKIPRPLCCPPAPLKRRSIPVKRKLPANPIEGFYILSDSDLQFLFGSELEKRKVVPKSLK